jgi:hypothetical protein
MFHATLASTCYAMSSQKRLMTDGRVNQIEHVFHQPTGMDDDWVIRFSDLLQVVSKKNDRLPMGRWSCIRRIDKEFHSLMEIVDGQWLGQSASHCVVNRFSREWVNGQWLVRQFGKMLCVSKGKCQSLITNGTRINGSDLKGCYNSKTINFI